MSSDVQRFIEKWRGLVGKETGNLQPFLLDLCRALDLPEPGASTPGAEYCFEYSVPTVNEDGAAVTDEIDLYKKGHFILEGKRRRGIKIHSPLAKALPFRGDVVRCSAVHREVAGPGGQGDGQPPALPAGLVQGVGSAGARGVHARGRILL